MKIILGDNQFFGINHFDIEKGSYVKKRFDDDLKIKNFICESLNIGLNGFMINSNELGYKIISKYNFPNNKEIHYSIPYPHKYANIVNEEGMISLLSLVFKKTSLRNKINGGLKLLMNQDLNNIAPLAIDLEVPSNLKKGSYVYLQNIITDMILGLGRFDVLNNFIMSITKMGYKPGLISLNPIILNNALKKLECYNCEVIKDLVVCFNLNVDGFNVFPNRIAVEEFVKKRPKYKLMAMSIFSSGSANITNSIKYIKNMNLEYIVFGSSKIKNISSNLKLLKS